MLKRFKHKKSKTMEQTQVNSQKGFFVYRIIGKNNKVLYIGKTKNINERMRKHAKDNGWWSDVMRIETANLYGALEMDVYEKYYIAKHRPKFNVKDMHYELPKINLQNIEFKEFIPSIHKNNETNSKNTLQAEYNQIKEELKHIKNEKKKELAKIRKNVDEIKKTTNSRDINFKLFQKYIANIVLTNPEKDNLILPSARGMSNILQINKSSIARCLLKLSNMGRVEKITWGDSPRQCYYKIIISENNNSLS